MSMTTEEPNSQQTEPETTTSRSLQTTSGSGKGSTVDLSEDPRFDIPSVARTIVTAEDANMAYLRGEIDEDQLRAVRAAYGVTDPIVLPGARERPDDAFDKRLPEDLVGKFEKGRTLEERQKLVEEKQRVAEAATKAAEKIRSEAKPTTDLATLQNEAALEAAEKEKESQDEGSGETSNPAEPAPSEPSPNNPNNLTFGER